jgi:hypothetical protein
MVNGANIAKINFKIVDEIKKELRLQGHYLTGSLERSFEERQTLDENEIALEAFAYAYLEQLEKGVEASDIPALNKSSSEFQGLVQWVKKRGLETAGRFYMSADSIAEAIWRKWQKEGKPLETSKAFSKTGEILGAVDTVFKKHEESIFQQLDEEAVLSLDKTFFK